MITKLLASALTAPILAPSMIVTSIAIADTPSIVIYTYDESGNRISRVKYAENTPEGINAFSDSSEIRVVTALPNPTSGLLSIELSADAGTAANSVSLYSLEGTHLRDWGEFAEPMQIDLSPYPAGWYVIHVYMGRSIESIKILKY
ncbi:MAG: T9SS type A sorting domain-containing protein [Muribaculum sp.]|nr:T9SS type A sorting domain-containing protein [Muribaculum sp.]